MTYMQYKHHTVCTVNTKMNMILYTKRFTCILGIYSFWNELLTQLYLMSICTHLFCYIWSKRAIWWNDACLMWIIYICSCLSGAALKDSSKRSINNDWKIELPGEFELAGTTVRYVRRGLWEKMSAKGPTKTPLHLMVKTLGHNIHLSLS